MTSVVPSFTDDIFDIGSAPEVPDKVSSYEWIYYETGHSPAALEVTENELRFEMIDVDSFMLPAASYLEVRFTIKTDADANIDEYGAYMNGDGWHAFQDVQLFAGDTLIQRYQYPGPISTALSVTEYTASEIERASQEGFFVDKASNTLGILPSGIYQASLADNNIIKTGGYNSVSGPIYLAGGSAARDLSGDGAALKGIYVSDSMGAQKRMLICGASKQFNVKLPLAKLFKIFQSESGSKVSRGIKWRLTMRRNSDERALCSIPLTGGVTPKFRIKGMKWWVPRVKPRLAEEIKLNKLLSSGKSIPLNFLVAHVENTDSEDHTAAKDITINFRPVNRPRRLMLFVQNISRYTLSSSLDPSPGSTTENQYAIKGNAGVFDNLGITSAQAYVNGKEVNLREYRQTFDIDQIVYNARSTASLDLPTRLYHEFLEFCGGPECESAISFEDYYRCYPIITWIVDYPDDTFDSSLGAWDVRIELTKAATATLHADAIAAGASDNVVITVVSWGESESSYKMDNGRMVFNRRL